MNEIKETIRLFDADAYQTTFEASVLSCQEVTKDDTTVYNVILDQTLFFPEEGGQSPDKGILGDVNVLDVQIKNEIITHTLEKPLTVGAKVNGAIDWTHRFNNMQQHSGEHIFSGLVNSRFGFDNVGFHLSDQIVTMDFNGVISDEDILDIEWAVNDVISKNIPIEVSYPSKDELKELEYRSKIEIEGQVRIVTIPGYDVCACCAPHVKQTGEIGFLKVMNTQNYKGGVRITILCGFRALEAMRQKCDIVSSLTNFLTTGQENILDTVTKLKSNNQRLSAELSNAKQALLESKLESISDDQENVILFESGIDAKIIRNVVNGLVEKHPGICGMFVENDTDNYNFVIGSTNVDCGEVAKKLRENLNAKGGGNNKMCQGSVSATKEDICKVLGI